MSAWPFVRPSVRPYGRTLLPLDGFFNENLMFWVFWKNLSRGFKFHSKDDKNKGNLTWRYLCIFYHISLSSSYEIMRNVSHKLQRKSNTHFIFSNFSFFPKIAPFFFWDYIEKCDWACHTADGNIIPRMPFAYSMTKATGALRIILLFHGSNSYANAPHCYVIRALPLLLICYSRPLWVKWSV